MKKMNFLKILMTLVLAFVVTGAFAQGTDLDGDGADFATSYETTGTTHMIAGQTVPLFAMPDSYYHPDYDPTAGTPDYSLTADFLWNWSVTGVVGGGAAGDITFSQNGVNDNYVEITGGTAGSTYTINVQEESPAAYGACTDAGENIDVVVHAVPSVTIGGDASYEDCPGGTFPANVTATISGGWQNYRVEWTLQIHTLDNLGAIDFYYDDETGLNPAAGAKFATGAGYTAASPDATLTAGANVITTVAGYNVIDNKSTVYTYVLTGINDQASRYGDFTTFAGAYDTPAAGDFSYFGSTETITIKVNPAPNTGPIYHINSNWAL